MIMIIMVMNVTWLESLHHQVVLHLFFNSFNPEEISVHVKQNFQLEDVIL